VSVPLDIIEHMFDTDDPSGAADRLPPDDDASVSGLAVLQAWRAGLAAEYDRLDEDDFAQRLSGRVDLSGLLDILTGAAERDMAELSDDGLLRAARDLEAARRVLDATSLAVLGELETRDTLNQLHGLRTGTWFADATGQASGVARARVRLAADLRDRLPEVADAMASGRVGEQHARALVTALNNSRITELLLPIVPDLIADAQELSFDLWRAKLIALVSCLDADGPEPKDPCADNTVTFTRGLDGRWVLRGEFDAVTGAVIRDAVTARADSLFHARRRDEEVAPSDLPTPSHRRLMAQGMHEMARADRADRHKGAGPAPETIYHLDAADPSRLVDDDGIPIGDTGRRTIMCDPLLRGVVFGLHRTVLDVGELQRLVTAALRRALDRRDGGCVFPRCTAPASWTDAHHVHHWQDGGPTDLANLASLCRYHHGVSHRKGWTMGATDDEWFWWVTPTGDFLWSQRKGRQRTGAPPPQALQLLT